MADKKGHYRVDRVLLSGREGVENKTLETIASGLTYKEAKKLQMALYAQYGHGRIAYHPIREKGVKT